MKGTTLTAPGGGASVTADPVSGEISSLPITIIVPLITPSLVISNSRPSRPIARISKEDVSEEV